jgi:hydrogenase nickel incorporation protein HypA/HybF
MHEYSLVEALLQQVEAEARSRNATAVRRIRVRIGPLAGVERRLFASAFDTCRGGTLCSGADLELADDPVAWCCEVCGARIPEGRALNCPACEWPARLTGGDALVLERVELEVLDDV